MIKNTSKVVLNSIGEAAMTPAVQTPIRDATTFHLGLGAGTLGTLVTRRWCLSTAIMHREKVEVKLNRRGRKVVM